MWSLVKTRAMNVGNKVPEIFFLMIAMFQS